MTALVLNRRQVLVGCAATFAITKLAHAEANKVQVIIENLTFVPADITVKAGDTIEWINKDPFAHTATVKNGWEVMIPPGKTASHSAGPDDSVDYYCRFHPNMKGKIKISG